MGTFQCDFRGGLDFDTHQRLRAELWQLYVERVDRLVRAGGSRLEAERLAIKETRAAFTARHPELPDADWSIRVVQP